MMGRPASACGSVAAAREASLRLRHQGHRLRRDEVPPSPRSARRRALSPASTSVSDIRDALLHRLRLRRAAQASPPPSAPRGIGPLAPAFAAPEFLDREPHPPPSPASSQRVARSSPASTAQEALRAARSSGPPSPPRWIGHIFSVYLASAASTLRGGRRCRRRLGLEEPFPLLHGELSSAYAAPEHLHGVQFVGMMPPESPRRVALPSSSACTAQEAARFLRPSAQQHRERFSACVSTACSPLSTHRTTSIAMLRASLAMIPPKKPSEVETSGPVLIITNPEFAGSLFFYPYSFKTFRSGSFPIDIANVLYSNGALFLLKEATYVSLWDVKSHKKLLTFHIGVEVEQGYFRGSPDSEMTIVLARQRVFAEQVEVVQMDDNADDEDGEPDQVNVQVDDNADEDGEDDQVNQDIVTEFWLRTSDGAWRQNAVVCAHVGIHSLIIHDDALFWLSDDGCLCSLREDEDGLQLTEWEGAVETIGASFSLLEDLGSLYIVTSGGMLPNLAGIFQVVAGDPPAFPETRMTGKDVFIVHGKSGLVLCNQTEESRVFSAPLIEDADCSRFSYGDYRHDNIRPCQSELFHAWCAAAWAVM